MKLSFDWLADFVDLTGLSAQDVADKLTMGAFEVEEVSSFGPDIQGPLLIGEILEINPHPNADKIRITKIKLSENQAAQEIVCGAWNIEVGQKIPVALPGARVINRHDGSALHIKESKIRGVQSNGMLCSPPELGIDGGSEGILILDAAAKIGADAKEYLGLKNDYILHVEPRSNRGDALSVLGLAREVAALFGRELRSQEWMPEFAKIQEKQELPSLGIEIENLEDCPFFTMRVLANLKVQESHQAIKARLESIGVKTVNNIVDITNYVLHELGQPLHAYDFKLLSGDKIIVRRAKSGECLKTLDEKERALDPEALIIADSKGPLGVAGVMGGKDSEISGASEMIALEAACFAASRVRRSSRLLGLASESSLRFERQVDRCQVLTSSNRASYLLAKYCGAELAKLSSAGSDRASESVVTLRMSELKRVCQIELSASEAAEMLKPLGFERAAPLESADSAAFEIPSFRQKDVYREIDLIEEVTRLYGYDRLPISMPASTLAARTNDTLKLRASNLLAAAGLSEAWVSSLTSVYDLDAGLGLAESLENAITVENPLSQDHQVLRLSLIPGLIKAASYNQDRGNENPALFEAGKIYRKDNRRLSRAKPDSKQTFTIEETRLAAIACQEPRKSIWSHEKDSGQAHSYYFMKGVLENLAGGLGIKKEDLSFKVAESMPEFLHPGRSAACYFDCGESGDFGNNARKKKGPLLLGYLGEVHPLVADNYRLKGRAAVMEISLPALEEAIKPPKFSEPFVTPQVSRDLTCDLEDSVCHQDVEYCIRSSGEEILRELDLVSVFKLSETQKSLSYRLTFQHQNQTLTSDAIDSLMSKIRLNLSQKLDAKFRG